MKAALILHGYFDSLTDLSSKGIDGFYYIKKHILDKIETDVFIHSWQPELENYINNLYNPKFFIYEPQINFSEIVKERDLDSTNYWKNMGRPAENRFSYFYSLSKAFSLLYNYAEEDVKYDVVIKGRFDLGRINRNIPKKYEIQCINFNPNLDMNKVYLAYWDQLDKNDGGISDIWWYSNFENMKCFQNIYSKFLNDYSYTSSDFYHNLQIKNTSLSAAMIIKQFFKDNDLWEKIQSLETYWE
jgi:hypothetical protein